MAALEKSSSEERARTFVQDLVITQLYGKDINELWNPADPARILNTILHKNGMNESEFRLIRKAGSNTLLAVYHVGIYSNKTFVASGNQFDMQILSCIQFLCLFLVNRYWRKCGDCTGNGCA